jgi:hypothetical protein
MADTSRSTIGIRSISGISSTSSSSSSSYSTSRRTSVAPSERTRDITLPSMSADSSSATIRPTYYSTRQPTTLTTATTTKMIDDEMIDSETAWALALIQQQDLDKEKQWDEWAESLIYAQNAREKIVIGEKRDVVDLSEVERLRMEIVEVQMRSIR